MVQGDMCNRGRQLVLLPRLGRARQARRASRRRACPRCRPCPAAARCRAGEGERGACQHERASRRRRQAHLVQRLGVEQQPELRQHDLGASVDQDPRPAGRQVVHHLLSRAVSNEGRPCEVTLQQKNNKKKEKKKPPTATATATSTTRDHPKTTIAPQ